MRQIVANPRSANAARPSRTCAVLLLGLSIGAVVPVTAQTIITLHRYDAVDEIEIVLEDVDFMAVVPKVFLVGDRARDEGTATLEPMIRDVRRDEIRIQLPSDLPAGRYYVVVVSQWTETDVTALLGPDAETGADGTVRRVSSTAGPGLEVDIGELVPAINGFRLFLVSREGSSPYVAEDLELDDPTGRSGTIVAELPESPRRAAHGLVVAGQWTEKVVTIR